MIENWSTQGNTYYVEDRFQHFSILCVLRRENSGKLDKVHMQQNYHFAQARNVSFMPGHSFLMQFYAIL